MAWPVLVSMMTLAVVLCSSGNRLHLSDHSDSASVQPDIRFPAPEQRLADLPANAYTILAHEAFPGYGVRIKRVTDFCDPSVRAYTGYLDVEQGSKHLFFYFFESRSSPKTDDLLAWFNGGPGCSSSIGLLMELGPCVVNEHANDTVYNPYGWNDKANLFFLDQPVRAGFSYSDHGETIETTEDAAKDVAAFVYMFIETFTEFRGRPFHIAGESYAGRYLPVFASEILDQNKRALKADIVPINLKSVLIGNGITDFGSQVPTWYEITCTNASIYPILDISACVRMKRAVPRCEKMLQESCYDQLEEMGCTAAVLYCYSELMGPFQASGRNQYDISVPCIGPREETQCYPMIARVAKYLNRPETRRLLGVDKSIGTFAGCSAEVSKEFSAHMDIVKPNSYYISSLLERGIDILLYVGTYDFLCNWVGVLRWAENMEWYGQAQFKAMKLEAWEVDGQRVGIMKTYGGLTYATVDAAGHMVPYDKPAQALELLDRWLQRRRVRT